jgi:SHS2 domain-containing protein
MLKRALKHEINTTADAKFGSSGSWRFQLSHCLPILNVRAPGGTGAHPVPMDRLFEILEHPSDLGIRAWDDSLAGAFINAARGLLSVILEGEVRERSARIVTLTASDRGHLLVRWLSEVLYLYDAEHFVPAGFRFTEFSDTSLRAEIKGEAFDGIRHQTKLDVKAVTYHQLAVEEHPGRCQVTVYLDI